MVQAEGKSPKKKGLSILAVTGLILGFLGGCFLGAYILFRLLSDGMCGNSEIETVYSPDGKHKVLIFSYDCGATTSYQGGVSILDASKELSDEDTGNIFSIGEHPDWANVNVYWKDNRTVVISYSDRYYVSGRRTRFVQGFQVFHIEYILVPDE